MDSYGELDWKCLRFSGFGGLKIFYVIKWNFVGYD